MSGHATTEPKNRRRDLCARFAIPQRKHDDRDAEHVPVVTSERTQEVQSNMNNHSHQRKIRARPAGRYRSQLEQRIADRLEASHLVWAYEPVTIRHNGREYTPDFLACGAFTPRMMIEAKPSIAIANDELRQDMLVYGSPLWLIAEVFIVATDDEWWVRADGGMWIKCSLSNLGLEYHPADVAP